MDIPPVNIGPERIISSCDGVVIKEKDFKYRVRQTSIYVHGVEYYNATEADRYIAHQKYKRCLAMAKWCRESLRLMRTYKVTEDFWNLEPGQDAEYFCKKGDFYSKWRKRWLQLAEKFKEAR